MVSIFHRYEAKSMLKHHGMTGKRQKQEELEVFGLRLFKPDRPLNHLRYVVGR